MKKSDVPYFYSVYSSGRQILQNYSMVVKYTWLDYVVTLLKHPDVLKIVEYPHAYWSPCMVCILILLTTCYQLASSTVMAYFFAIHV